MSTVQDRTPRRSPLIRITAAVLAVIMLLSAALYERSGVRLNSSQFEEKGNRVAAQELLRDDDYANASRLEQMTAFARNLLSGQHTQEDLELGIQISIAQANYEDAIGLTQKLLEGFDGDSAELGRQYLRLGYLYVMTKDHDSALKYLDKGIAHAPTAEAYLTRAQVYLEKGDMEAALADTDLSLQLAENPETLYPDMVNIFEAAGEFSRAAEIYTNLIARPDGSEYLLNRAYCYTNLGRMEEASADRDAYAAAGGTELGQADVMLGIGWMRAKDYVQADDCFVRAIDGNYSDPESLYYYVVLCAYVTGNYERVCIYGDQLAERIRGGAESGTADVSVVRATGRLNVSLVKMDTPSLYLMTGASHLYRAQYDQAAEYMTLCLETDSSMAYANYLRGTCRLAEEKYAEAIPDFDTAIAAEAETEKSYFARAICRTKTGDREGALADYDWVVLHGKDPDLFTEASRQIQTLLNDSGSTEDNEGADKQ